MKLKSYFANSVEDAMAMARQELGPDAMLVNSRKSFLEARHLGAYEVVFVTEMPDAETGEPPAAAPGVKQASGDRLAQQLAELKKELEGMRRTITRSALPPADWQAATLWIGFVFSQKPNVYAEKLGSFRNINVRRSRLCAFA